jgi:hypothetical protein
VADWKLLVLAIKTQRHIHQGGCCFLLSQGGMSLPENQPIIETERAQVLQTEFPVLMNDLNERFVLERLFEI